MKKTFEIIGLCLAGAAVFNACDKNIDTIDSSAADKEVVFNLSIGASTRTVTNGLSTAWADGDKVGIFSDPAEVAENIELTRNAGKFSGEPVYLPESGSADFFAYYPYSADTEGTTFMHKVDTDQSAGFNHSDLLIAKGSAEIDNPVADLTFSHALALVEVFAKNIETASGITITAATESAVNLKTQEILTLLGSEEDVVLCNIGDRIFRGIVPKQTLENSEITMTTTDGKTVVCPVEKAELSLGSRNRFTLTPLSDDQIEVTFDQGQNISDWGDIQGASDNWVSQNINNMALGTEDIFTDKEEYTQEGWFNFGTADGRIVEVVEDTDGFKSVRLANVSQYRGTLATGYRLVRDIDVNTTIEVSYEIKGEALEGATMAPKFEMVMASSLTPSGEFIKRVGQTMPEMNDEWNGEEAGTYKKVSQKFTLSQTVATWGGVKTTFDADAKHTYLDFIFTRRNDGTEENIFHIRNLTVTYIGPAEGAE